MHGKPLSCQDTPGGPETDEFEWQKFFDTANVFNVAKHGRIRALVFSAVSRMHRSLHAASMAVELGPVHS